MDDADYRTDGIALTQWPELRDMGDGRWERTWEIQFEKELGNWSNRAVEESLSEDGFHVTIAQRTPTSVSARVVTDEWGWADKFYISTFRMLAGIEQQLGSISQIQGQPKSVWWPWRAPGPRSPSV